jgi:hypothetical protein
MPQKTSSKPTGPPGSPMGRGLGQGLNQQLVRSGSSAAFTLSEYGSVARLIGLCPSVARIRDRAYRFIVPSDEVAVEVEPDLPDAECHWRQKAVDHG